MYIIPEETFCYIYLVSIAFKEAFNFCNATQVYVIHGLKFVLSMQYLIDKYYSLVLKAVLVLMLRYLVLEFMHRKKWVELKMNIRFLFSSSVSAAGDCAGLTCDLLLFSGLCLVRVHWGELCLPSLPWFTVIYDY